MGLPSFLKRENFLSLLKFLTCMNLEFFVQLSSMELLEVIELSVWLKSFKFSEFYTCIRVWLTYRILTRLTCLADYDGDCGLTDCDNSTAQIIGCYYVVYLKGA